MEKFIAFVLLAIGLIYSDLESSNLFYSWALPALVLACLVFLFWYKAFLALCGAYLSYHFMDIESQSMLRGGLMPLLFGLCILLFLFWAGLGNLFNGGGDGHGGGFGDFDGGDGGGGGE